MNTKGFTPVVLVLIVVVLVAIGAVGYFVARNGQPPPPASSPSSTDTTSWKTYRNEQYGFEFKYPAAWRMDTYDGSPTLLGGEALSLQIYSYPENNTYNPGAPVPQNEIKIEGDVYRTVGSLDELIKKLGGFNNVVRTEDIVINGVVGKKVWTHDEEFGMEVLGVYYVDGGRGFSLTSWPSNSIYLNEFDQILSTFKFIKPSTSATSTLKGKVSIGPICPVERIDVPCPVPPEAYASREFLVLSSDRSKTITRFHANASGTYIVTLPPGTYVVVPAKTGIGNMSKDLPATITIKGGETSHLDISVDTGIR